MEEGQKGVVSRIGGNGSLSYCLISMGIIPGSKIQIISKGFLNGPISIFVKGSKIGLGRFAAQRIYI